jgi:translocation and assembly module TamB
MNPALPHEGPPRRTRWRTIVLSGLALAVALAAAIGWLASTTSGLVALVALAERLAPIAIQAIGTQGELTEEFGFEHLRVAVGGTTVELAGLRVRLRGVGLRPLRLDFESLSAGRVAVTLAPGGPSSGPPESIASPVAVSARRLRVDDLDLDIGGTRLAARAIDAEVSLGPDGYEVAGGHVEFASQPLTLAGRLGGRRPFALALRGTLSAAVQGQTVLASWHADGSLLDFVLAAEVQGGEAHGNVAARVGSFDQPPLKSLQADIDGVDLRAWRAGLPKTRLALRAELQPDAKAARLAGPVRLVNREPGTIDSGRLPLREAQASVELTRERFSADGLAVELVRGRARGHFSAAFGAAPRWQAELQLDGVDPAAIHSRVRPLLIDGNAKVAQSGGTTSVHADLRNRGAMVVNALLDLRASASRVDLERVELSLGNGRATTSGTLGLTGERRVSVQGTIERFDAGLLVKDLDARVSGDFVVEARLAPRPNGQLHFELKEGRAFGRPLAGHGTVRLDEAQQLDVDVQLAVRSARLSAQGGLGPGARSLAVALDAPALDELLPAWRGGLKADATLRGDWATPAVDAHLVAKALQFGNQSLKQAELDASYGGGADGRLSLKLSAVDHATRDQPALSLRAATLAVEGSLSAHEIKLHATTANSRELALAAQGGLSGRTWRGALNEASVGAPLNLRLLAGAPLAVGAEGVEFGPAPLALAGALVEDAEFAGGAAGLRTSGRFTGLQLQEIVAASAAAGAGRPKREGLTLRGEWHLRLGAQAEGTVLVERSGGDLYAGSGADTGLRVQEARVQAELKGDRVEARAVFTTDGNGRLDAHLNAALEHDGGALWRLARAQPWQVEANAELPSLALVNAVLGEQLAGNLRLGGSLAARVNVEGTPSQPRAQGTLTGDALRFGWVEQGIRLENGRLRARLDGDVVVLDEFRFTGSPRVHPKQARAAEAVDFKKEGSLSATGQLRLRDLDGLVRVQAQQLPLLQRPDRWLVASGDAQIEASLRRLQLNGSFSAVAGYFEASPSGLPSLSSDVVVVTRRSDASDRKAAPFELGFDVGFDLGNSLYVEGAGVSARAEGQLRVRSAGRGAVTATGAIETKDGRYDGFGQHLAITRGRLNFQGPLGDPGIDALALRTGLPVEVGVSITGTASKPLVRLHSDPAMSDSETMSWLVLGHAGDQTKADNLALLQAASGLLAGSEAAPAGRFARSLGVDISLRSGDLNSAGSLLPQSSVAGDLRGDRSNTPTTTTEILSIAKRINDKVTIGYEQALSGTEYVVQVSYRLSQRLSVMARAGTDNALDLVYSIAFD